MQQRLITILFLLLLFATVTGTAQQCTNRFTGLLYKGGTFSTFTHAVNTTSDEVLAVGNLYRDHGFAVKFSAKGTPLFSYQYNPVYQLDRTFYSRLQFSDVIQLKNGSFLLTGSVTQNRILNLVEHINRVGVVLNVDAFGNVLWCRKFESVNGLYNSGYEVAVSTVLETTTGDIIIYLASDYGRNYPAYGRVVCFSATGNQKWNTLLATNDYDGGVPGLNTKRKMFQAKDGSVITADVLYKSDRLSATMTTLAAQLHFFSVDAVTGKIKWETNYQYPTGNPITYSDIIDVAEMPNNKFVFTTSSIMTAAGKKALRIVTNNRGVFEAATTFAAVGSNATELLDVTTNKNTGLQTYLLKSNGEAILAQVTTAGTLAWQQGYNNAAGRFPPNCFSETASGYGLLMSNFNTNESRLLLTTDKGIIDCANKEAQLLTQPIVLEPGAPLLTEPQAPDQNRFGFINFPIRADAYPLQKQIECEEVSNCCTDVIDSAAIKTVTICEGSQFTLPNNTIVNSAGTYYVVYKTAGGCDSITFYRIKVDKNPAALTLGADQCLENNDSITLTATEGYERYQWMTTTTTSNEFKIQRPGTYWVRVSNTCGNKTDSINLFKNCDFPIYIPTAFTPNNDGKNDVFGVPLQNKNAFVSLAVFNRWGQLLFSSTDINKSWNGQFKNIPQPTGTFIYVVEMKGLSGNRLSKKGTVLLIR